jgi:hypothetical protein
MRALLRLHAEYGFTNSDISQLLHVAEARGIKLSARVGKDASKPCYRIVAAASNDLSAVVLEETANVDDDRFTVRAYADGSVSVERR